MRWVVGGVLLVVWLLLWGEVSVGNLATGMVVAAVVVTVFPPRRTGSSVRVHPVGLVRLVGLFAAELIKSTWSMTWTVVHPTPARLRAGVVAVPLRSRSPVVGTIVADFVTLTPGTLSLSLADGVLHIHVLGLGDPDDVRADVLRYEAAVLAAVEPKDGR